MILFRNIVLVLQKSKQAKTRVDFNGKRVGLKNGRVFLMKIRIFDAWLQLDAFTTDF